MTDNKPPRTRAFSFPTALAVGTAVVFAAGCPKAEDHGPTVNPAPPVEQPANEPDAPVLTNPAPVEAEPDAANSEPQGEGAQPDE